MSFLFHLAKHLSCTLVGEYDGEVPKVIQKNPFCVFSKAFPREIAWFSAESLGFLSEQLVGWDRYVQLAHLPKPKAHCNCWQMNLPASALVLPSWWWDITSMQCNVPLWHLSTIIYPFFSLFFSHCWSTCKALLSAFLHYINS